MSKFQFETKSSNFHIVCQVKNDFFKDGRKYNHIKQLKEDHAKFTLERNKSIKENPYEEIIKIIYNDKKKGSKDNNVNITFSLKDFCRSNENFKNKACIYLIKTNKFSWYDKDIRYLIKKLKKNNSKNDNGKLYDIEKIGILNEKFEFKFEKNSSKDKNCYFIYFITVTLNDITMLISQPFTIMSNKQFSKRSEDNYLKSLSSRDKDKTITNYYYNILFKKNSNVFNKIFNYKINFFLLNDQFNIYQTNDKLLLEFLDEYIEYFESKSMENNVNLIQNILYISNKCLNNPSSSDEHQISYEISNHLENQIINDSFSNHPLGYSVNNNINSNISIGNTNNVMSNSMFNNEYELLTNNSMNNYLNSWNISLTSISNSQTIPEQLTSDMNNVQYTSQSQAVDTPFNEDPNNLLDRIYLTSSESTSFDEIFVNYNNS